MIPKKVNFDWHFDRTEHVLYLAFKGKNVATISLGHDEKEIKKRKCTIAKALLKK